MAKLIEAKLKYSKTKFTKAYNSSNYPTNSQQHYTKTVDTTRNHYFPS